jgi:N6-adenosine-specific RNA methylase IME4
MKGDAIIVRPDQTEAEWYVALIEECKAIITETIFNSRWALVEGYHALGERILQENDNFAREKIYGQKIIQRVGQSLGKSEQTIFYAVAFAKKWPDLTTVPEGKNISWHKICNKYLSAGPSRETPLELPEGQYNVIVIDPPWPIEKIQRDCRPNQVAIDYPTMTLDEISALRPPAAEDSHIWLWTTHRFLPAAFRILADWSVNYICAFVWHKPGGFQVAGLPQFNCEFALYGRIGSPEFSSTKGLCTCFSASRGKHSEKPEAFYEMIRNSTTGRRLDMFSRREIEGFNSWGNEAPTK